MVFSDTTTKLGLIQDCEVRLFGDNGYGKISDNENRLYQFTGLINRRQDRFVYLALTADGQWQADDTNWTDYPIATRDIASGTRDYQFALEMIQIEKVVVTDSLGKKHVIDPIDIQDESDETKLYLENASTNIGTPRKYDKIANSLIFQPTPNYNYTAGIEVYFKRGPYYFLYTDTTNRVPGFPSIFHDYLSAGASLDYAINNTMTRKVAQLAPIVQAMEIRITDFFSKRRKDEKKRATPAYQNNH